jgi:hypothetical protein
MSHLDHQRWLLDMATQLAEGQPLSAEQSLFLAVVLYRIGTGEDANAVLSTRPKRGEKLSAVIARRRMSLILHWVACAISPDPTSKTKAMSLSAACELAMTTVVPLAKSVFPGGDDKEYDADYILRCWSSPRYSHMRSTARNWFDADFPYQPSPAVKHTK